MRKDRRFFLGVSVSFLFLIGLASVAYVFVSSLSATEVALADSQNLVFVSDLEIGEGRVAPVHQKPVWIKRHSLNDFDVIDLMPRDYSPHCAAMPYSGKFSEYTPVGTKFRNLCSSINYDEFGEAKPMAGLIIQPLRKLKWTRVNSNYLRVIYAI